MRIPEIPDIPDFPDISGKCSDSFQQCGGKKYTGVTCCKEPYSCVVLNEYYSQCKYIESEGDSCQAKWKQCGGLEWKGETCCKRGFQCVYKNEWYSHCL